MSYLKNASDVSEIESSPKKNWKGDRLSEEEKKFPEDSKRKDKL